MKRKMVWLFLIVFCLLFGCITAAAMEVGSLCVEGVEAPVCLYHVAGFDGVLTEDFRDAEVTDLSEETAVVQNAKILYSYVCDRGLAGKEIAPDQAGQAVFTPLEEGIYLVCSLAEEGEFTPFLVSIPTRIQDELIYHVQAKPKEEAPTEPTDPTQPSEPVEPEPEIPQTGSNVWPQYILLAAGVLCIVAGFVDLIRGREKKA